MITILGATGHTGNLIVQQLTNNSKELRLAGRDLKKLTEIAEEYGLSVKPVFVDVDQTETINAAVDGASVLINCAGPFTAYGVPVVEKCLGNSTHHIDITGEQHFIATLLNDYSSAAKDKGVALVTSCAFEYAIADAAAKLIELGAGELSEFESTYIIEGMYTSRGTKKSVLWALSSPSYHLIDGERVAIIPGKLGNPIEEASCRFPFPGGEVFLTPLHTSANSVRTYLASEHPAPAVKALSVIAPIVAKSIFRPIVDRLIEVSSKKVEGHKETRFKILCSAKAENQTFSTKIAGFDPYTLTAVLAARVAEHLNGTEPTASGVVSASMILGATRVREIMLDQNVDWKIV